MSIACTINFLKSTNIKTDEFYLLSSIRSGKIFFGRGQQKKIEDFLGRKTKFCRTFL